MTRTTTCRAVLLTSALAIAQLAGCGQAVSRLSDEQLQLELDQAEREWKVTGAGVAESDAPYITDPKIQASYKNLKALRTERDARAKARR